ncbi:MAG TPA: carboxypeptidase regulatory-like domain-containing protein [Thermoanaerobaculia bacterium]
MNRKTRAIFTVLSLLLALGGSLYAIGEGRVLGTVVDESGKPVADVTITLTRAGSNYKQDKKTDGKGKFTLMILDATQEYQIRIEKQGFTPFEEPLKPKAGDTMRVTYTLVQPAPAAPAAPAEPSPEAKALEGKNQAILAYNEAVQKLKLNDVDAAAAKFQEAAQLDPNLPEPHAALADIYISKGKNAEALAAANQYLKLRPEDQKRVLSVRYDAALALGDKATADAALDALVQAEPGRDTAVRVVNKGVGLFNAGKIPEAIEIFQRALQIDPTLAKTHYMLGLSYGNSGEEAKAKEHLTKFLEMAPDDENAGTAKEMLEYLKTKK